MAGLHGKGVCGGLSALLMSSDEEFQEEEVWGLIPNTNSSSSKPPKSPFAPACRRLITTPLIPKSAPTSSATHIFLQPQPQPPREASKPIDFPGWARILKEEPNKKCWDDDDDVNHDDDDEDFTGRKYHDDDDEYDNLPPHEMLAKKYKKNRVAYSMCEGGVGRTLKGRDLRNVRNTILFKTGFIERM